MDGRSARGAGHGMSKAMQGCDIPLEALDESAAVAEEFAGADYLGQIRQFLVAYVSARSVPTAGQWSRSDRRSACYGQFSCAQILLLRQCYSLGFPGQPAAPEQPAAHLG